jgi:imidazolonepropionase-like amidohydrolase
VTRRLPLLAVLALAVGEPGTAVEPPATVAIRGGTLWTQGEAGVIEGGVLLVRAGKIAAVGRDVPIPEGVTVLDAAGRHVTPGLVDCHSHTAIRGGVNEGSHSVTAEVRIADVLDPDDIDLYRQLAGGLTTAHILHGSANAIGGQSAVVKLKWGVALEELLLADAPPGVKFALGENPKRSNFPPPPGRPPRYPGTRMGVMETIREHFLAARDYARAWAAYESLSRREQERREPPRRDLQLEAIVEILRGERLIHSHAYRQDEILALLRLAEEFGVRIGTFQHVLEGYKVADELAAHGAGASTFSDWWAFKLEAYDAIPYNGALMHDRGVRVSFNSDSSELARRLNLEAAKAVKYGSLPAEEALALVTLHPARQLGLGERIGSLEVGKDADFVLWSGDPLSVYSVVDQTWVDGRCEFDRAADLARRVEVERERRALVERIRRGDRPAEEAPAAPVATSKAEAEPASVAREPGPLPYLDRLAGSGPAVSILHATVHTISGPTIDNATVSFRAGRIVEVGRGLAPLPGAEIVEARGRHVYPGLIDANSAVGLTEISSVSGSVDLAEVGEVNPNVQAATAIHPDSELIGVTRANGLTHTLTVPSGGLISGSSALIRLDGWTAEDLRAASPVALHIRWPSFRVRRSSEGGPAPTPEEQERERKERIDRIRRAFDEAQAYGRAREVEGPLRRDADPALEALLPALDGRLPVVIHAEEVPQVESALAWAEEAGVRLVIAGAGDLWRVAERLAARRVPVIVTSVLALPAREDEPYDTAYTLPAKLHAAGVRFCIATSGTTFAAPMTRTLPYHAAMAAAFGLERQEALRAVTLHAAGILGLDHALGSIEAGKSASLIVTDGDPLEIRTRIERAYIDGRPVDLGANRHDRLYERYRARPTPP